MRIIPKKITRALCLALMVCVLTATIIAVTLASGADNQIVLDGKNVVDWCRESGKFKPTPVDNDRYSNAFDGDEKTLYYCGYGATGWFTMDLGGYYDVTSIDTTFKMSHQGSDARAKARQAAFYASDKLENLDTETPQSEKDIPAHDSMAYKVTMYDLGNPPSGFSQQVFDVAKEPKFKGVRYIKFAYNHHDMVLSELKIYGNLKKDADSQIIRMDKNNISASSGGNIFATVDNAFNGQSYKFGKDNYILLDLLGVYDVNEMSALITKGTGAKGSLKVEAGMTEDELYLAANYTATVPNNAVDWYKSAVAAKGVRYIKISNPTTEGDLEIREFLFKGKKVKDLKSFTVKIDSKTQGSELISKSVYEGSKLGAILPEDPAKEDMIFAGWYYRDPSNAEVQVNANTRVSGNMSVYAKFSNMVPINIDNVISEHMIKDQKYPVTLLFNGDLKETYNVFKENIVTLDLGAYYKNASIRVYRNSISSATLTASAGVVKSEMSAEKIMFDKSDPSTGWINMAFDGDVRYIRISKDNDGGANISELQVCGDKSRDIPRYNVKFETNGGSKMPDMVVKADSAYVLPGTSHRDGYRLVGWYIDESLKNIFILGEPISGNMKLYAKWEDNNHPVTYTIKFDSNGGTVPGDITGIPDAATVAELPVPQKSGQIFAGWYSNNTLTTSLNIYTPILANTIAYAMWVPDESTNERIPMETGNIISKYNNPQVKSSSNYVGNMFDNSAGSGWGGYTPEYDFTADLGSVYKISEIMMSTSNKEEYKIYAGNSRENLSEIASTYTQGTSGPGFVGTKFIKVDVAARYIKVSRTANCFVNEFRLFGINVPTSGIALNPITDLRASNNVQSPIDPYVELRWTVPSLSGFSGAADAYEIKYSKQPIDEGNWDSATAITDTNIDAEIGIPHPSKPGMEQTFKIYDLYPETTYYFAVKTKINWGTLMYSSISNVATVTTIKDEVPPLPITDLGVKRYKNYPNATDATRIEDMPDAFQVGAQMVNLTLTATGDNANRGTAASYTFMCSNKPFPENGTTEQISEWTASLEAIGGLAAPQKSGTFQTVAVGGLTPGTQYYGMMFVRDKGGNIAMSNVVSFRTKDFVDNEAPGKISDLKIEYSRGVATLNWSAPGNDGWVGMASRYEIRYMASKTMISSINDALWNASTPVDIGDLEPQFPGYQNTFQITNIDSGYLYYVTVRAYDVEGNVSEISNTAMFGIGTKIKIPEYGLIQEFPDGMPYRYIDEQDIADPGNPHLTEDERKVLPGPTSNFAPITFNLVKNPDEQGFVFDLGAEYYVTELYGWALGGIGGVSINIGKPFSNEWKEIHTEWLVSGYNTWSSVPINAKTRYIRIQTSKKNGGKMPLEIMFYGIPLGTQQNRTETKLASSKTTSIDEMMGSNIFIDDYLDNSSLWSNIRDYHNWRWDCGNPTIFPNNVNAFSPSAAAGGNSWFFDEYYARLHTLGIDNMACIQMNVSIMDLGYKTLKETGSAHPAYANADWQDPQSYYMHSDYMFQFAARYGSKNVDDSLLKLKSNQTRVSGLNLVDVIECGNENDQSWSGRTGYHLPFEAAALASADMDGHCGTMGSTFGAKNADPDIGFSMHGMAGGANIMYFRAMAFWAQFNRKDGKFPSDYINGHIYTNTAGNTQTQTGETEGAPYEESSVINSLESLVKFRNTFVPGAKLLQSEIGWDSSVKSPQGVRELGSLTQYQVQAAWLMRAFMIYDKLGWEKVQQYMMRDATTDPADGGKYGTSGVITFPKNTSTPETYTQTRKTSWYFLYTMKNVLRGMSYVKEVPSGDPRVSIYMFADKVTGEVAYAVWANTSMDTRINNFQFKTADPSRIYTMVTCEEKSTVGKQQEVFANKDGVVTVEWVTEIPVFLKEGFSKRLAKPAWNEDEQIQFTKLDEVNYKFKDSTADLTTIRLTWPTPYAPQDLQYYTLYVDGFKKDSFPANEKYYDLTIGAKAFADVELVAGDMNGQESEKNLKGKTPVDFTNPSKPRNIEAFGVTANEASLRWTAASDNRDIIGNISYRVYDGDKIVSEGVDTALTVTGLKSNTKYDLTVTAVDAAGNESERSTKVSVKTGSNSAVNLALLISLIVLATVIVAAIVYLLLRRYMRMKKAKQLFAEVGNSNLSGAENLPETGSEETDAGDNSQDDSAI